MIIEKQILPEVLLLKPKVFSDERGFFVETLRESILEEAGIPNLKQQNQSRSQYGVLRGLHFQLEPESQGKLVKCLSGKIFDAVVDIRIKSKTFASWVGVELSEQKHQSLWVPPGFAHGFFTLSDYADVQYLVTKQWNKDLERCIVWNDEDIGIDWPVKNDQPLISAKDAGGMTLSKANLSGNIFK